MTYLEIIKEFRQQFFKRIAIIQDECTLKVTICLLRYFLLPSADKGFKRTAEKEIAANGP